MCVSVFQMRGDRGQPGRVAHPHPSAAGHRQSRGRGSSPGIGLYSVQSVGWSDLALFAIFKSDSFLFFSR